MQNENFKMQNSNFQEADRKSLPVIARTNGDCLPHPSSEALLDPQALLKVLTCVFRDF